MSVLPGTPTEPPADGASMGAASEVLQASFCAALVDEWVRSGLRDAVICPGSRSAPLALALAEDGRIHVHVRLDERSAGFFAIGIALASRRPVVVCVTSGTAAAELHPAVVEAHHARVPLIVLTADRPPELHDVGAAQSIDQARLFGRAVRFFADPGVPRPKARGFWRSLGARAYAEALCGPLGPGPVHLNLPFEEPLVGSPDLVPEGRASGGPWHEVASARIPPDGEALRLLEMFAGKNGVVLAGAGSSGSDPSSLGYWRDSEAAMAHPGAVGVAEMLGWPLIADARSGCHYQGSGSLPGGVALLGSKSARERLVPEVVLRLGGTFASKAVGSWLEELASIGVPQVVVDPWWSWPDPWRSADELLVADPDALCRAMLEQAAAGLGTRRQPVPLTRSDWHERWQLAGRAAEGAVQSFLDAHPEATEPGVARVVSQALPRGSTLVVSSSMPVRDLEWFGMPMPWGVRVLANRGANGIDGVVSTALGVAACSTRRGRDPGGEPAGDSGEGHVVALVGDLAFLHDSSAWVRPAPPTTAAGSPPGRRNGAPAMLESADMPEGSHNLTVVVVDNAGGGIFSTLPYAESMNRDRFEQLFGTPMGPRLSSLGRALGLHVEEARTLQGLDAALARSLRGGGSAKREGKAGEPGGPAGFFARLVRVVVPSRQENAALHREVAGLVEEAVGRLEL